MLESITRATRLNSTAMQLQSQDGRVFSAQIGNAVVGTPYGPQQKLMMQVTPGADGVSATTHHTLSPQSSGQNLLNRFAQGMPAVDQNLVQGRNRVLTAQWNMRHGQLRLTGMYTGQHGQTHYTGHYLPNQPKNIAGTNFSDFAPGQNHLIEEHLEFYRDEFNEGANAQINRVEVAPRRRAKSVSSMGIIALRLD